MAAAQLTMAGQLCISKIVVCIISSRLLCCAQYFGCMAWLLFIVRGYGLDDDSGRFCLWTWRAGGG